METNSINTSNSQQESTNIGELMFLCLTKWYWFVISLILCIGGGVFYILKTPQIYTRTASVLIKSEGKGNSVGNSAEFTDLGLITSNTNINNEIGTMRSPDLMLEVVRRLGLDVNYQVDGRFHKATVYGSSLPLKTTFVDLAPYQSASFVVDVIDDQNVELSSFVCDGVSNPEVRVSGIINDSIVTPAGIIVVSFVASPTHLIGKKLYVTKSSMNAAKNAFCSKLKVAQGDKGSSIIQISCSDVSTQRADDVILELISAYNDKWMEDKNQISVSTSLFINERLAVIEDELGNVDDNISSFKSENLLPDVQAAASMYMAQANEANASIKNLNNQVYMARYIRNYLSNSGNHYKLIPINSAIDNINLSSQISDYNRQLQDRNSLVSHSSESNPLVQEMDYTLTALRQALVESIDNQLMALDAQIKSLQGYSRQATSQIKSNPKQAKYLLSVERQQKVKESLYLYLLQKREENEISQAFTAYNTRIISYPSGGGAASPDKNKILLIALLIGMALPVGLIYLKEMMNTVVRGRKDLESLSAPFVGEIPLSSDSKQKKAMKDAKVDTSKIVVKEKSRNVINEAFRVVRTNLEFIASSDKQGASVINVTSANPGSGKTFITFNMATVLAIKGKKVLAMDLDLRKGSLSKYVNKPKVGLSNYLAGKVDNYEDLIIKDAGVPGLDALPIGMMPPNPTELLFSPRFEAMIKELRQRYDYIFFDCPPVEIVADVSIINQYVDHTVFIVRAGLMERAVLPEVEKYYTEKKFKNMCILLNGTEGGSGYGKYGRYGHRYSYGYKYGYNYGYGGYAKE